MRQSESGVILVNVLVVLALGAALVVLMFGVQDDMIDRARRASAGSQAEALAMGGEASVIDALRRDMDEAPETDHLAEPWATVLQDEVVLDTGRFSVAVTDVRGRIDLNALAEGDALSLRRLALLVAALDLPENLAARIANEIARRGPVANLSDIDALDPGSRATLSPYVDVLPVAGPLNLNAAGELVMAVILNSPAAARALVARRQRVGFLTQDDLAAVGVLASPGAGFTSDLFDIRVRAEVDGTSVNLATRLLRTESFGVRSVRVLWRRFGIAAPEGAESPKLE